MAYPRADPAKIQRAVEMFSANPPMSRNAIAREAGIGQRRVSELAVEHGHDFTAGRARTAEATKAIQQDNAAMRAVIVRRQYARMAAILDRLEAPGFKTILKGSTGGDETRILDFVPTPDERNLADAQSRLGVTAMKLELVDAAAASSRENAAVDLWLNHMAPAA